MRYTFIHLGVTIPIFVASRVVFVVTNVMALHVVPPKKPKPDQIFKAHVPVVASFR